MTRLPGNPDDVDVMNMTAIRALYQRLLAAWNARDAGAFADLFAQDGESVGFDGSQLVGRAAIADTLRFIFADHPTGRYVSIVRGVRSLASGVALLRADAGIVPAGQQDIAPALNTTQTLIATRADGDEWRIVLYQNTPAQFHGRPDAVQALSEELRRALANEARDADPSQSHA